MQEDKEWKAESRKVTGRRNLIGGGRMSSKIEMRTALNHKPQKYYDELQLMDDVKDSEQSKYISIKATNNQSEPYPRVGLRELCRHRSAKNLNANSSKSLAPHRPPSQKRNQREQKRHQDQSTARQYPTSLDHNETAAFMKPNISPSNAVPHSQATKENKSSSIRDLFV